VFRCDTRDGEFTSTEAKPRLYLGVPLIRDDDEERQTRIDNLVKELQEVERLGGAVQKKAERIAKELATLREQQKPK
jgi:hypothetical protein